MVFDGEVLRLHFALDPQQHLELKQLLFSWHSVGFFKLSGERSALPVWYEIAFDCTHTAHIAQGLQAASLNRDIHIVLRALVQWIESRVDQPIRWRHISGHSGDPWNEAADTVCRHAAQIGHFTTPLHLFFDLCTFDTQDFHSIQWLWLLERSLQGAADAPELRGHWWRFNVSAPLSSTPDASIHPAVRRQRNVSDVDASGFTTLRVIPALPVAWVDDLAIPIASATANQLIPEIQWVLDTVIEVCASFGPQVNLKPKRPKWFRPFVDLVLPKLVDFGLLIAPATFH